MVFVSIDSGAANDDEQFIDPTKVVAYNFFTQLEQAPTPSRSWPPLAVTSTP